ncbi:MAG: hypothetical protein AMJ42_03930 [Deltaproteobacteria bacterium DG_8]|nr:MAG: hypothetical protein AMJ42_03930 [Deltaproteobacteria bacterium DG_8]
MLLILFFSWYIPPIKKTALDMHSRNKGITLISTHPQGQLFIFDFRQKNSSYSVHLYYFITKGKYINFLALTLIFFNLFKNSSCSFCSSEATYAW